MALLISGSPVFGQTPTTTNGWFQLFQAKNDFTWSGSDGGPTCRASNGQTYWAFGDTVLGTRNTTSGGYNGGWFMVANTILVESNGVLRAATSTSPAIPDPNNGDRYWPLGLFEASGYLYCLCQRVMRTNTLSGFLPVGAEFAKFQFQPDGQLTFLGMIATPGTGIVQGIGPSTIQWADDAIVYNGYVYVFGDALTGVFLSPKAGYVCRVAVANLESTNAWTFWNGSSWVANMSSSAAILPDNPTSVRVYGGKWVMLYKPFAGGGNQAKAAIAVAPQGPYSPGQVIFPSASGTTSNGVTIELHCYNTYNPMAHPEYPLSSGKLLVSIAWNGCDLFNDTARDAGLCKPRFYEITLPGIPPVYPPVSLTIERDGSGGFFIRYTGAPNITYRLQRAASVTGTWTNLATNTAPASGLIEYHDTSPLPGQTFYRSVQP
jgi:hypothetical protein